MLKCGRLIRKRLFFRRRRNKIVPSSCFVKGDFLTRLWAEGAYLLQSKEGDYGCAEVYEERGYLSRGEEMFFYKKKFSGFFFFKRRSEEG